MFHVNLNLSSVLCQVEKKDNYEQKKSAKEKCQPPDPFMSEGFA